MRIADADGLIKHFENVVDVKFFTPANVITIIKTFSGEVEEGHVYTFRSEDNNLIATDLTEKQGMEKSVWHMHISFMECKQCSAAVNYSEIKSRRWNYCPNCGAKMLNADSVLNFVGGTEP